MTPKTSGYIAELLNPVWVSGPLQSKPVKDWSLVWLVSGPWDKLLWPCAWRWEVQVVWGELALAEQRTQDFLTWKLKLHWVYSPGSGNSSCDSGLNRPNFGLGDFRRKIPADHFLLDSKLSLCFKFWTSPTLTQHWGWEVVWGHGDLAWVPVQRVTSTSAPQSRISCKHLAPSAGLQYPGLSDQVPTCHLLLH